MALELFPECLSGCPAILASPEACELSSSILSDEDRQPNDAGCIELSDDEAAVIRAAFAPSQQSARVCYGVKRVREFIPVGPLPPDHLECGLDNLAI